MFPELLHSELCCCHYVKRWEKLKEADKEAFCCINDTTGLTSLVLKYPTVILVKLLLVCSVQITAVYQ